MPLAQARVTWSRAPQGHALAYPAVLEEIDNGSGFQHQQLKREAAGQDNDEHAAGKDLDDGHGREIHAGDLDHRRPQLPEIDRPPWRGSRRVARERAP